MNQYDFDTTTEAAERQEAATLLRAIRSVPDSEIDAIIDFAWAVLQDHPPVRRVKIASLLRNGHLSEADTLIAQGLLLRPDDPGLIRLRIRRLLDTGRVDAAATESRRLIEVQPSHTGTRRIAAEVAQARGDFREAERHLTYAIQLRPDRPEATIDLIALLLLQNKVDRAQQYADTVNVLPVALHARLLIANGRMLDARDILESALAQSTSDTERDDLLCQLVQLATMTDDPNLQRALLETIDTDTPAAHAASAHLLLENGAFGAAIRRAADASIMRPGYRDSLIAAVVGHAFTGEATACRESVLQLYDTRQGLDRRELARTWRSGFRGHILNSQRIGRRAGGTARGSLLRPMLRRASRTLDQAFTAPAAERHDLVRHRKICREVLDQWDGNETTRDHDTI